MSGDLYLPPTVAAAYLILNDRRVQESRGRILLSSGVLFDPMNPDPALIDIRDIARGLACEIRYAGHVAPLDAGPITYTVAQHSVLVSRRFSSPTMRMAGLLHDAEEGLGLKDLPSPVKAHPCFATYRLAGETLRRRVFERFGVEPFLVYSGMVHEADDYLYRLERASFWGVGVDDFDPADLIHPWSPVTAEVEFLREFDRIRSLVV